MNALTHMITRRAALGAIASIPALGAATAAGTLAPTSAPTTPAEHPDAALFLLEQEMEAAEAAMQRALKTAGNIDRTCEKLYPPEPAEWKRPVMPDDVYHMFANMSFRDQHDKKHPEPVRAWFQACDEQHVANNALHAAHRARLQEIKREHGLDAAEDAFEASTEAMWRVGARIFVTPAHTIEGMMVKIRAGERMDPHLFIEGNEACSSLAADIRRLAAGGAS